MTFRNQIIETLAKGNFLVASAAVNDWRGLGQGTQGIVSIGGNAPSLYKPEAQPSKTNHFLQGNPWNLTRVAT